MSEKFKAVVIDNQNDKFSREIKNLNTSDLKDGNVLVKIDFSSLNFKTNDPAPPFPLSSYWHLTEQGEGKDPKKSDKFDKTFSLADLENILVDKEN